MKNILSIVLLAMVVSLASASAQDTTILRSKKGTPILPKKGDWAIGVDASPFLRYVGNMLNGNTNNTLNLSSDNTIYGRYFIADDAAIRVSLTVSNSSSLNKSYVQDDAAVFANPLNTEASLEDHSTYKYNMFDMNVGYVKFRGYGRLRGFYGASVGYGLTHQKYEFAYANTINELNSAPTTTNFSTNYGSSGGYSATNGRILEYNYGNTHAVSVGAIAGVEYYILPKLSLGGEITLRLKRSWTTHASAKFERWNNTEVETYNKKNGYAAGSSATDFSTSIFNSDVFGQQFGGGLYLMFHF